MNTKDLRQVTFELKDGEVMKYIMLSKKDTICYGYNMKGSPGSNFPYNYAQVFTKDDNNIVYLNGKKLGVLEDGELLAGYAHSVIQSYISDKTTEEADKFIRNGVL